MGLADAILLYYLLHTVVINVLIWIEIEIYPLFDLTVNVQQFIFVYHHKVLLAIALVGCETMHAEFVIR